MEVRVPRNHIASAVLTDMLQRGVACPARTPATVTDFVTRQLGWLPEYLRDRISTIFVDGKVVDDPDLATLADGASLGLSAAMPGLVGATLRRSGYYAAMRSQINWSPEGVGEASVEAWGRVEVRLFNLILLEKADALLARGILVEAERLPGLLTLAGRAALPAVNGEVCLLQVVDGPDQDRE